jgi:hypothetical protein
MQIQINRRLFRTAAFKFRFHSQSLLRLVDLLDYYIHEMRCHNAYILNCYAQLSVLIYAG